MTLDHGKHHALRVGNIKSELKNNYNNLDVLRALAVLSVVAQHLWHQFVNFGLASYDDATNQLLGNLSFTGVMFFFVHTCLVLMLSMNRSPRQHLTRSFFIRRAFRIYPLCWATIGLVLLTGLTDHPKANLHLLGWKGLTANVVLIQNATRAFPSVVGPLWSLPWEMQMYLVLPAFFLFLQRSRGLITVFALWLGAAALALLGTAPSLPRMLHSSVFPPMFIAGMVAFVLLRRNTAQTLAPRCPAWLWPIFVLALFALKDKLAGPHVFETQIGSGVNSAICLVLAVGIANFRELTAAWIVVPAQQIAKYSYGIYLLHVPSILFVLRYLPRTTNVLVTALICLALTALVAVLSFRLLEDPLMKVGKRLATVRNESSSEPTAAWCDTTMSRLGELTRVGEES